MIRHIKKAIADLVFLVTATGCYTEYEYGSLTDVINKGLKSHTNLKDILPEKIAALLMEAIENTIKSGTIHQVEYSLQVSGREEFFQSKSYPVHPELVMLSIQNITEFYNNREKLDRRNALLKTVLKNIIVDVLVFDNRGNLTFTNRNPEQSYVPNTIQEAMESGLVFTKPSGDIYKQEELPLYRAIQGEEVKNEIIVKKEKGYHPKTYIVHAAPLLNNAGKKKGIVLTTKNITDIETLQNKFDAKSKDLDTFLYRSSHDLKAPLASMKGVLDLATNRITDSEALKYIDLIQRSHSHLNSIVEDLVSLAHVTRKEERFSVINLNTFISGLVQSLGYLPQAKEIKIKACVPSSLTLTTDENQLRAVLQNLITNAINHHRKSGDDRYILVMAYDRIDDILIEVIDNGIGIPKEIQSKVYDVFYRGNPKVSGSGLGLFIVKEAVQKLAGNIELESVAGEGTTFSVMIPKYKINEKVKPGINN